jgi:hypothetical protein
MQTANKVTSAVAGAQDGYIHAEPLNVQRRIGSTVYEIEVYVKTSAAETIEEKIMRLIRNDLHTTPSNVTMGMPQTGRLPERSSA